MTRPTLLEREQELEMTAALLERAGRGEGGLLLVEGPAGLGKSSLLDRAERDARNAGMAVLTADGRELEQGFAFGGCRRLFEEFLAAADPRERAGLLAGAAAGCAPAIGPAPSAPAATVEEQLFPILHGLFWLVSNLAERTPLLLCLDDAHWADVPSLRFLHYLAARADGLGVALVVAVRTGEPGPAVDLLDRLRAEPAAQIARPRPLGGQAVASVVHGCLPEATTELTAAIIQATGGNPLLVVELAHELAREGIVPGARFVAEIADRAPQAVRPALLARVARLGPDAVAVARAAAVLGSRRTGRGGDPGPRGARDLHPPARRRRGTRRPPPGRAGRAPPPCRTAPGRGRGAGGARRRSPAPRHADR